VRTGTDVTEGLTRAKEVVAGERSRGRSDTTIHGLFEEQVALSPDAPAVIFDGVEVSYGGLNTHANQVAHYLRRRAVGVDTLVALYVERSVEMVAGLLGVLKAGAAYVPIDPDYPQKRVGLILEDCGATVLLSQERLFDRLPALDAEVVCLDRASAEIRAEPSENPAASATALDLAYVIYTSGSTGRPKGVAIPHGGACNLARAQQELFAIRPDDRVLQFAALGFDASVSELTMALLNGAALYIPSDARRRWRLAKVLEESAVTVATLPPSAVAALPTSRLPALERLIVAGETCPPGITRAWSIDRSFYNAYGPTETSVCASAYRVSEVADDAIRVPIGEPIVGVSLYVLDGDLELASDGRGELYIGGAGVARGYLRQPSLTAERFLPDPFSPVPGARMYRSGDLVRWNDEGQLEFLGRVDEQVKVNGFRIEPAEIEAALVRSVGVREAVVLVDEDERGTGRLTAYIVQDDSESPPTQLELRQHLSASLPAYMVPAGYVVLEEFPFTPNGKVDRRGLAGLRGYSQVNGSHAPATVESVREDVTYRVVANGEEQYSIWPAGRELPDGWRASGEIGLLNACLSHIGEIWTDLRPRSVRDAHRWSSASAAEDASAPHGREREVDHFARRAV
jgi:amino acid adenylation domain-containing protein